MLRKRAVEEETKWRTAHGFDTKLRGKHQVEAKQKWQRLERGEEWEPWPEARPV